MMERTFEQIYCNLDLKETNNLPLVPWVMGKLEVPVKNKNCQAYLVVCSLFENKTENYLGHFTCWASQDEDDAKSTGQRRGWKNREHTR